MSPQPSLNSQQHMPYQVNAVATLTNHETYNYDISSSDEKRSHSQLSSEDRFETHEDDLLKSCYTEEDDDNDE